MVNGSDPVQTSNPLPNNYISLPHPSTQAYPRFTFIAFMPKMEIATTTATKKKEKKNVMSIDKQGMCEQRLSVVAVS